MIAGLAPLTDRVEGLGRDDILQAHGLHESEQQHQTPTKRYRELLDHGPANDHGIANCWIHRRHDRDGFGATRHPGEMPTYDFRFTGMADMVAAHRRES